MADAGHKKMWESLRADMRVLDREVEAKMSLLETLAHTVSDDTTMARLNQEIAWFDGAIGRMKSVLMSMHDLVSQLPQQSSPDAIAMSSHTSRFEDVIREKETCINRLKAEAVKRRERAQLLHKVHSEITVYNESSDMRTLAQENESLRHTQRRTREILEQSEISRSRLHEQRQLFNSIGDKAVTVVEKVPGIKNVLKRIDQKRRRDVVILGIVIAICILLVFVFW